MFGCGRDRVVSARIQWMAAADAPQRQPAAAQRAVAGDRLHGVFRAGWHETAAWPEQGAQPAFVAAQERSEAHTSELQSLMRISYAVFCLQKKKKKQTTRH